MNIYLGTERNFSPRWVHEQGQPLHASCAPPPPRTSDPGGVAPHSRWAPWIPRGASVIPPPTDGPAKSPHLPPTLAHVSQLSKTGQKDQLGKRRRKGKEQGCWQPGSIWREVGPPRSRSRSRPPARSPRLSNLRRPILARRSFPIVKAPRDITVSLGTPGRKESVTSL